MEQVLMALVITCIEWAEQERLVVNKKDWFVLSLLKTRVKRLKIYLQLAEQEMLTKLFTSATHI
jgi:hypothetical protein